MSGTVGELSRRSFLGFGDFLGRDVLGFDDEAFVRGFLVDSGEDGVLVSALRFLDCLDLLVGKKSLQGGRMGKEVLRAHLQLLASSANELVK